MTMFHYDEICETVADALLYENEHVSRLRLEVWLAFAAVVDGAPVLETIREQDAEDCIHWCFQAVAYIVTAVENGEEVDIATLSTIEDRHMTVATWKEWRHMWENVERWARDIF